MSNGMVMVIFLTAGLIKKILLYQNKLFSRIAH